MGRIQSTILIETSPEAIWEVINDADCWSEWVAFNERVTYISEGPFGEGTVYREKGGPGPLNFESEWRVTEFDPPRRQVHHGNIGIMQPVLTFELDPLDGYTRVHQTVDFELLPHVKPLGRLLERLFVRRMMQRALNTTVRNLKQVIEEEE